MKYSLKDQYKSLLKEELAIVKRLSQNNKTELFDVDLFKNGNIKGKKVEISDEDKNLLKIYNDYCSDSDLKLINFIKNNKDNIKFRININDMNDNNIVNYLNQNFSETINWNPNKVKDKGRGEVSLHLAFNSDLNFKEPDFVSHDNKRKFSVKSFITNQGNITNVRSSKDNRFIEIYDNNKEIKSIFDNQNWNNLFSITSDFIKQSSKTYNPIEFKKTIEHFVIEKDFSKEEIILKLKKIKEFLNEIKIELTKDHGSECIIGIDKNKQFFIVNRENAIEKLGIYRINGNEITYYHTDDTRRLTFSKVIDILINEVNQLKESKFKSVYKHLF
jgi:hypothetical protein